MYHNERTNHARPMYATEAVDTSYMGAGCAMTDAAPVSELEAALVEMERSTHLLNDLIGDVERRLSPVLCQPGPVKECGANGQGASTPLLQALSSHANQLGALSQRIAHLNSRIIL